MAFIKWDESYSVGINEVDVQHKHLVELLNDLAEEFNLLKKREIGAILYALIDYASYHFKTEEDLLIHHDDIDYHISEHQRFVEQVSKLQQDLIDDEKNISKDVLDFMWVWLQNHILGTDKVFFAEIQSNKS